MWLGNILMNLKITKENGSYFVNGNKINGGEYFLFSTTEKTICIYFKINGDGIKPNLQNVTDFEVVNIWEGNTSSYVIKQVQKKINKHLNIN